MPHLVVPGHNYMYLQWVKLAGTPPSFGQATKYMYLQEVHLAGTCFHLGKPLNSYNKLVQWENISLNLLFNNFLFLLNSFFAYWENTI